MKVQNVMKQCVLAGLFAMLTAGCSNENAADHVAEEIPQLAAGAESTTSDLVTLLAAESRPEADRARDVGRKPADVIAFLGIEPGMNVIDIIAASGYYTEVLSIAVGPGGQVTTQNPAGALQRRDGANDKALTARLAENRLPNVARLDAEIAELTPGPFDAGITALNLHDIYNGSGEEVAIGAMSKFYSILKPGGVFGVIDHQGVPGNDNKALHRLDKADAIRIAKAAGFVVEAESRLLNNDEDDMSQNPFAEGIRGHTNRFLLRLRKPE